MKLLVNVLKNNNFDAHEKFNISKYYIYYIENTDIESTDQETP